MSEANARKRLSRRLLVCFAVAMIMGPGPGILLVNPDASSSDAVTTIANLPILYLWALFWYSVQVTVLLVAYFKVWGPSNGAI
ncbi:hypothetical protein OAS39_11805 [Pirellulales bacterium]|nr:hypothetical protein [Pirellulales bacterium]